MARLAPRPWLMIHGQRDTYIGPEIAQSLFDHGKNPKELWLVPEAKHNRCRETDPEAYAGADPGFSRTIRPAPAACRGGGVRRRGTAGSRATSPIRWRRRLCARNGDSHLGLTQGESGRRRAMIKMLMRLIGAPVAKRVAPAGSWRFSTKRDTPATSSASSCS